MNFPKDLKYSKEHTWIKAEGQTGTIGITEFAQSELGEIVYADLPDIGKSFKQNEVFGTIEALKTVSDLFMPVGGKIIETNKALLKEPTLVNDDPFGNGWLVKIDMADAAELSALLTADAYQEMTAV